MDYLPHERRDELIRILKSNEYAEISYLSKKLGVSEMTIRRDIDKLEQLDEVRKVYGGVQLKQAERREYEGTVAERKIKNADEKKMIALEAIKFINNDDVIAFDASTSALAVSQQLKFKKKVTVVTNNINIAIELSDDPDITVILLGGFMRKNSLSLTGSNAINTLESIYINKAFISSKSINYTDGITDNLMDEGEVKQAIIRQSELIFGLYDKSKIGTRSFFKVSPVESLDFLITSSESAFNVEQLDCIRSYKEVGIKVLHSLSKSSRKSLIETLK